MRPTRQQKSVGRGKREEKGKTWVVVKKIFRRDGDGGSVRRKRPVAYGGLGCLSPLPPVGWVRTEWL